MGFLDIKRATKSYGAVKILHETEHLRRGGRVPGARRPVGLRQVHAAQHDRRARGGHLRRHRDQGPLDDRGAPGRAQHRHGVPELRALPEHERRRRTSPSASRCRRAEARARQGGGPGRRPPADQAPARPQARPALRRPAPARRHGPGAGAPPGRLPLRRAALEPRRQAPRRHAHRDQEAAPEAEDHHRLRHPRPDRGADALDPDRGDVRRPRPAARHAEGDLRQPDQHLRRGLHGLAVDEPLPAKIAVENGRAVAKARQGRWRRGDAALRRRPRLRAPTPAATSSSACGPRRSPTATAPTGTAAPSTSSTRGSRSPSRPARTPSSSPISAARRSPAGSGPTSTCGRARSSPSRSTWRRRSPSTPRPRCGSRDGATARTSSSSAPASAGHVAAALAPSGRRIVILERGERLADCARGARRRGDLRAGALPAAARSG